MQLIASLVVLFAVVGCGSAAQPTSSAGPSVSSFENDLMSFEYPGNWNALVPESGDAALVLLSTEELATTEPRIQTLGPDGVYVAWTERSVSPVVTPNPSMNTEVQVGGRTAVLTQEDADGDCAGLDGDQLLTVRIDSAGPKPDVQMQACVRGPNFELTSATIAGMLASVEWKD